jgi:hypothetical protein
VLVAIEQAEALQGIGAKVDALSRYEEAYLLLPEQMRRRLGPSPQILDRADLEQIAMALDEYRKMFSEPFKHDLGVLASRPEK